MTEEIIGYLNENTDVSKKLVMLGEFYEKPQSEILKIGLITALSQQIMPNYKNYTHVVSGITQARMVNGVKGKRYVENQVENLETLYGLDNINEDILEKAIELVLLTIDSIYDKNNTKTQRAYKEAIEDPEFLFINLQLVVKILGEHLRKNHVDIVNKTLKYMTEYIEENKNAVARTFMSAYVSGDRDEILKAKGFYKETMTKMLTEYVNGLRIPHNEVLDYAMELKIVEKLGKENLETVVHLFLIQMKEQILQRNHVQRKLNFE